MKGIHINHAYDGFLYSPLFLAEKLGLLKAGMKLMPRTSDLETVTSLYNKTEDRHNWFAICDPFVKNLANFAGVRGYDEIRIIGVLIHRLPVWLCTNHPGIEITQEDELKDHSRYIDKVRCYEKFNTGYLIGRRVIEKGEFGAGQLQEVRFGQEFKMLIPEGQRVLTVTSDVLEIAKRIDTPGGVLFNYAKKCTDLNPFFFTAILTLKSVIDEHLDAVLSVLGGLKTAITELSREEVLPEHIQFLVDHFGDQIQSKDPTAIVRKSIEILFRDEEVYPTTFDIANARKAYYTAKSEWERLIEKDKLNRKIADIETTNDPIPSLLIKPRWRQDSELAREFANDWRSDQRLVRVASDTWKSDTKTISTVAGVWRDSKSAVSTIAKDWKSSTTAISEVASAWHDDKTAISTVAATWANHEDATALLREKVCPPVIVSTTIPQASPDALAVAGLVSAVVITCIGIGLQPLSDQRLDLIALLFCAAQVGLTVQVFLLLIKHSEEVRKSIWELVGGSVGCIALQVGIIHLAELAHLFQKNGSAN